MTRLADLVRFYELLDELELRVGGKRELAKCNGRMPWPKQGVYFFFEPGEKRSDSGRGPRVVRVGTHALTSKSRTTLWNRLSQHRGVEKNRGGNHRGSIFRLIVGSALKCRDELNDPESWGIGSDVGQAARQLGRELEQIRESESGLEIAVSQHIGTMPFLWLPVEEAKGGRKMRGLIERNAIALLSNLGRSPKDPPSDTWLGRHSDRERVRQSGLWNNNHVGENHDVQFLAALEKQVAMV